MGRSGGLYLVLATLFVLTCGSKRVQKPVYKPYGPKMCNEVCEDSDSDSCTFLKEDLSCYPSPTEDTKNGAIIVSTNEEMSTKTKQKQPKEDKKILGDICFNTSECSYEFGLCLRHECTCKIGYSFDFTKNECVTSCSTYGSSFTKYRDSGIDGYNIARYITEKEEECVKLCREETKFVCVNVEYGTQVNDCLLSNAIWSSTPERYRRHGTDPFYTLFYRHCQK